MGATSLVNVTGRDVGSAAWPTTDMAAIAMSVAETVRAKRILPPASAKLRTSESLAQTRRRRTRIPVRLIQGQHVDRKRDSNDLAIALELTPCTITTRLRHVALESDRRASQPLRHGVEVFVGMGVHIVPHVLAEDERVAEGAEIRLEIGDRPAALRIGQREGEVCELTFDERRRLELQMRDDRANGLVHVHVRRETRRLRFEIAGEIDGLERAP